MLKGIPDCISPELLKILDEMGHGDVLVIGDANFPAASVAREGGSVNLRCDGHSVTALLEAILQLFPLDHFVECPVTIMDKAPEHQTMETPVWESCAEIIERHDERGRKNIRYIDRFQFYEEAGSAYAVISTTEKAFYACVMLQKGCLP